MGVTQNMGHVGAVMQSHGGQIQSPGAFYHVTSRGNERKAIFRSNRDRERLNPCLDILARMIPQRKIITGNSLRVARGQRRRIRSKKSAPIMG
jgi:hypothetical protein